MHPESTVHRPVSEERRASSLADCIPGLLARLGRGTSACTPGPGGAHGAARLSHLGALELLERHGCAGEWCYGRIEDIAPARFPLILQCKDRSYCLLLAPPRGDKVRAMFPAHTSLAFDSRTGVLQCLHGALYLSCQRGNGGGRVPPHDEPGPAPHWYFGALGLFD
jgi:hypothetical protein